MDNYSKNHRNGIYCKYPSMISENRGKLELINLYRNIVPLSVQVNLHYENDKERGYF